MAQDENKSEEWKNDELVVYLSGLQFPFMTDDLLESFYTEKDGFIAFAEYGRPNDFDSIVSICKEEPFKLSIADAGKVGRALIKKFKSASSGGNGGGASNTELELLRTQLTQKDIIISQNKKEIEDKQRAIEHLNYQLQGQQDSHKRSKKHYKNQLIIAQEGTAIAEQEGMDAEHAVKVATEKGKIAVKIEKLKNNRKLFGKYALFLLSFIFTMSVQMFNHGFFNSFSYVFAGGLGIMLTIWILTFLPLVDFDCCDSKWCCGCNKISQYFENNNNVKLWIIYSEIGVGAALEIIAYFITPGDVTKTEHNLITFCWIWNYAVCFLWILVNVLVFYLMQRVIKSKKDELNTNILMLQPNISERVVRQKSQDVYPPTNDNGTINSPQDVSDHDSTDKSKNSNSQSKGNTTSHRYSSSGDGKEEVIDR